MKKTISFLFAGLMLFVLTAGTAQADLSITVSPNGLGGTIFELTNGTGLTSGGQAFIQYGTVGDTFLINGTVDSGTANPNYSLGGIAGTNVFVVDLDGGAGLNSSLEFGFASIMVPNGSLVSELNGTYDVSGILFSNFIPGTYGLQKSISSSVIDIGDVTLNVVPEPSMFALLALLGGLACTAEEKCNGSLKD